MDFSVIFQLRTKKFWWMDVIFYFVISSLIATVLCYLIFLIKDGMLRKQISDEILALQTVGTNQQKEDEKEVIGYQSKIVDFANLLKNHEFASNGFAFMQAQTIPNIWFKQFSLDKKNAEVQLSGESDDMDAFSKQVAVFEKNEYVKSIKTLNSSLGDSARIQFNLNLTLDKNIFNYIVASTSLVPDVATPSDQPLTQQDQATPADQIIPENPLTDGSVAVQTKSSEKLITSFNLSLDPEIIGVLDQANYTFALDVPSDTDVKNLIPLITVSPNAIVSPASNVPQDFTSPVIYTVTAQDGSMQSYSIKVIVEAQPEASKKSSPVYIILLIIILICVVVIIITAVFLFLKKRKQLNKRVN